MSLLSLTSNSCTIDSYITSNEFTCLQLSKVYVNSNY